MLVKQGLGFTIVELMITLALAAIFLSLAVPGYYSTVQNNKVVSVVNNLSAALNYARTESIRRGVRVSVCAASSSSTCGSASQWNRGWLIFVDADNNNAVDATSNLLKIQEALPTGVAVAANNALVSYDSSGFTTNGTTTTLTINATGCTGNNVRILTVSSSGRLSITRAACS